MENKIEVKTEDERVITILEGKALDPINKKGYLIGGNITAVVDFLSKRGATVEQKTSHIEIDLQNGQIALIVDADSPLMVEVLAQLYRPDYFKGLAINEKGAGGKTFALKEMGEHLRMHRFLFADRAQYDSLIKFLTAFTAKVNVEMGSARNVSNGSRNETLNKVVEVEAQSFKMKTPLYVGGEVKTFHVDVCCDVSDASARFWLESIELIELDRDERDRILSEQKTILAGYGYAIISK